MIDFRYHLVSIVAVFLALAIGIVVGATALKPKTEEVLDNESRIAQHQISQNRTTIRNLELEIASNDALAQAAAPRLLAGLLEGQRVVLVTAPGSDGATISGITSDLNRAGAKVAGQVQLQNPFFDTSAARQSSLDILASKVAPSGITPGYLSSQSYVNAQIAGQQEAAQVLAPALVTKSATDLPASQTSEILTGFAQQGFLQLSSGSVAPPQATLAVVVIPGSPPSADASPENLALLSLAQQLALNSRGVVLAGSLGGSLTGSGPGSAIDELINGNTGIRSQVSSVDDADHASGQILVAQALSYLLNGQKAKAYGMSTTLVPDPAPTPAPSATSSSTPTPTTSPVRKNRA